jgi:hypothetical protein
MGGLTIETTLQPRGPAAAVVLTDEQVGQIAESKKAFPVVATINGYTWRGRVARMGGENLLGLSKEHRTNAGVQPGDCVTVAIVLDEEPREVELPDALRVGLAADPEAQRLYDSLAFTHRKEFARWVAEAKKPETRDRRVTQTLEMLHAGQTRS